MILTEQCKQDFETWYLKTTGFNVEDFSNECTFYELPNAMKYGLFVDFFDGVGIDINSIYFGEIYILDNMYQDDNNHRGEARIQAIEKANEIYNNYENRSKRFKNR